MDITLAMLLSHEQAFEDAGIPPITRDQAVLLLKLLGRPSNDQPTKAEEVRLRRVAERVGLRLSRSRTRDRNAPDFGRYQLLDQHAGSVFGADAHGRPAKSLDEIDTYLRSL